MLGHEVRLPVDIIYGQPKTSKSNPGEYLQNMREKLDKAHIIARKHLLHAANYHKCRYDLKASMNPYCPGDFVLYLHEERREANAVNYSHCTMDLM